MGRENELAQFEVTHHNASASIPILVAPFLGLAYILIFPFMGVAALIAVLAQGSKKHLVAVRHGIVHAYLNMKGMREHRQS